MSFFAEFFADATHFSSSTADGPDKVAYTVLKHLPRSGVDFLLHNFNLSWCLDFFPCILKISSTCIIPIRKMEILYFPVSFRLISLTSCVSKLFELIIISLLLFFLESNSILSLFARPVSALDDPLSIKYFYLSQSISDGFNKSRPGSRTILATIDFSVSPHRSR